MIDPLKSYIPKFLVDLNRNNEDIIAVSTNYFSPDGDVYQLDKRTVSPSVILTTQSLQELQVETSTVYPFKIVPPKDIDGSTIILSPSIDTAPTASQNYYTSIYFERYNTDVIQQLNKQFTELTEVPPDGIQEDLI